MMTSKRKTKGNYGVRDFAPLSGTRRGSGHPTAYCRGKCQEFQPVKKIRNNSIYEFNARCHNCESFIPRKKLIGVNGKTKAKCPCCLKTWMKGVYLGIGRRIIKEGIVSRIG